MDPLKFTSNTPGNIGALLDNVKLASTLSPTPEPSTFFLFLGGIIFLATKTLWRR
jgi:hypothetical protein